MPGTTTIIKQLSVFLNYFLVIGLVEMSLRRAVFLRWALMLFSLGLMVLAIILPNTALAWLRSQYHWFGHPLNWIESHSHMIGWVHVLLFALLGAAARLSFYRWPLYRLAVGLVIFAAVSELVQFLVPGRTPKWSDFAEDILGATLGVALASVILSLWGWLSQNRKG